nr:extracellular solute-binding protein [Sinorhizobium mexicanum]
MLNAICVASLFATATVPAMAQDRTLIDAAKTEGEVVWYTTLVVDQVVRPIAEAFEAEYGIKVNFVSGNMNDVVSRLVNEGAAGTMVGDLWDGSTAFVTLRDAGLTEGFNAPAAANFKPEHKDPEGRWYAQFLQYPSAAINTELVAAEEAPKTFEDLLGPKWKGRIGWTSSPGVNGPIGFIGNILNTMGEEQGRAYLEKLAQQEIANIPSNQRVVLDQAIAGQYPLVLQVHNYHAALSKAKGAPIEIVYLPTNVGNMNTIGLVKGAPHPNAAKLLIDFILSEGGQTILVNAGYIPANPAVDAESPELRPETGGFKANVIGFDEYIEKKDHWTAIYKELFE